MKKLTKKKLSPAQGDLLQTKRFNSKLKSIKKQAKELEDENEDIDTDSVFANYRKRLDHLEATGVSPEIYDIELLKALRTLVLDLIPVSEENYRKYPMHTNASAVNQYVNQEREIIADIRALEDYQARAERIINAIRNEYDEFLIKFLIQQMGVLKSELQGKNDKSKDTILNSFLREFGKTLTESQSRLSQMVNVLMVSGDEPKKKKH